jgi:hypothetical protein
MKQANEPLGDSGKKMETIEINGRGAEEPNKIRGTYRLTIQT